MGAGWRPSAAGQELTLVNNRIAVISSESDPKWAAMYGDKQTGFAEADRVSHTVSPTPSPWLSQPLTPSASASCIQLTGRVRPDIISPTQTKQGSEGGAQLHETIGLRFPFGR